jgi:tRNA-dihydrouridine synthase B
MPFAVPPSSPDFHIGPIPVHGRLLLAPMDGMSDLPFRSLCREFGSSISYTSFVAAGAILNRSPRTIPELDFLPHERPVAFQIFDHDEGRLVEAARRLIEWRPDFLDINMGCSSRCVAGRGAGAGLLRDPRKIGRIVACLARALPVPVTAKIRLGWDDASRNYLEVAHAVEDNGGRLVAVHGRTKVQGYTGSADWEAIGEIKAALSIPVIGNGDIADAREAAQRLRDSGCDAVMIGRAAIGNPWVFLGTTAPPPSPPARVAVMLRHFDGMLAYYGPERGAVLFRKHLARYIEAFDLSPARRRALLVEANPVMVRSLMEALPDDPCEPVAAPREAIILEG